MDNMTGYRIYAWSLVGLTLAIHAPIWAGVLTVIAYAISVMFQIDERRSTAEAEKWDI